jgi:hypothetical protein
MDIFGTLLFSEKNPIEEIDRRPHGTKPAAEKITKNHDQNKHPKGRKHSRDDLFLGEEGDDSDKGIEPKIEINRDSQLKRKSGLEDQVEKKAKEKGLDRPP